MNMFEHLHDPVSVLFSVYLYGKCIYAIVWTSIVNKRDMGAPIFMSSDVPVNFQPTRLYLLTAFIIFVCLSLLEVWGEQEENEVRDVMK